jgi:hypothetical protein
MESEYVASMIFAIYTKSRSCENQQQGKDILLETYEFKISYGSHGKTTSPAKVNDVELSSKDIVKAQAAKLIRSLTEFTATLDALPYERWLTIELKVNPVSFYFFPFLSFRFSLSLSFFL